MTLMLRNYNDFEILDQKKRNSMLQLAITLLGAQSPGYSMIDSRRWKGGHHSPEGAVRPTWILHPMAQPHGLHHRSSLMLSGWALSDEQQLP